MLQLASLSKSFGPQVLFSNVTFQLNPNCRYGLVGANGAGKTTFLKMLMGDEPSSDGEIQKPKGIRLGVLRQDRFLDDAQRIVDVCMAGDERVFAALKEQDQLVHAETVDAHRLAELEELISVHDGYTLEARASAILVGLGIAQEELKEPLGTLSGGYKLRVLLAQVLVANPEVLLLDEPTNHLDILSIRWLEEFLRSYEGTAVVISHDHHFLDRVATHILDVDYGTITPYTGNYVAFVQQKQLVREQKEAEIARQEKIIAEKKAFVERFKAKATKARQAQSRVKQIEKIEIEELPTSSRRSPNLKFTQRRHSGKDVLVVEDVSKAFGDKQVLSHVNLNIRRGERVAVIGANGLGKSTLLKIAMGQLQADAGSATWGHEVQVGYFAQDHRELLSDAKLTPLAYAWEACPKEGTSFVRGYLGRVLFSGDEVDKSVSQLSGGEAARLIFCKIMIEQPNVLVLDEPTNHLDLEAIEALVTALKQYDGTVIFVSHDRWFVSQLATRVVEVTKQGLQDFAGTYDEYLERSGEDHLDHEAVALRAKQDSKGKKTESKIAMDGLSWEERKRLTNRLKSLPKKRDQVVEDISKTESRLAEIQERYCEPDFYEKTEPAVVDALRTEEGQLNGRLEELSAKWEALELEMEELGLS